MTLSQLLYIVLGFVFILFVMGVVLGAIILIQFAFYCYNLKHHPERVGEYEDNEDNDDRRL